MFTTYIHTTTSTCVRIRHSPCALSTSARRLFHTARATIFALPGDHFQTFRNISLPHKLTGTVLHQSSSTSLGSPGPRHGWSVSSKVSWISLSCLAAVSMPRCWRVGRHPQLLRHRVGQRRHLHHVWTAAGEDYQKAPWPLEKFLQKHHKEGLVGHVLAAPAPLPSLISLYLESNHSFRSCSNCAWLLPLPPTVVPCMSSIMSSLAVSWTRRFAFCWHHTMGGIPGPLSLRGFIMTCIVILFFHVAKPK